MYQCIIENEYGEQLELTGNRNYTVYKIDGLEPTTANINMSQVANFDGSRFNSSRANARNIVIYLTVEGDCEKNRINLYKYAKVKRPIRFYYKNGVRDVYADGYVESMPIGFFDKKQGVQISILCPDSYFKATSESAIGFSNTTPLFVFPFAYEESGAPFSVLETNATKSIINEGDVENGTIIKIYAFGRALNPKIYNLSKNESFVVNIDMFEGDELVINTNKGKKSVKLTHEGTTTNVINSVAKGSTWFELNAGDNVFTYTADEYPEHLSCTFIHVNEYEGV